jgi:hypothetical protein
MAELYAVERDKTGHLYPHRIFHKIGWKKSIEFCKQHKKKDTIYLLLFKKHGMWSFNDSKESEEYEWQPVL